MPLARLYETGRGVPKDLSWARHYYQRAAEAGVPEAQEAWRRLSEPAANNERPAGFSPSMAWTPTHWSAPVVTVKATPS
jgi:TPR repeat protein